MKELDGKNVRILEERILKNPTDRHIQVRIIFLRVIRDWHSIGNQRANCFLLGRAERNCVRAKRLHSPASVRGKGLGRNAHIDHYRRWGDGLAGNA